MSWMGKLLGGGLGFVIGGPIGAVVGAVLGHHAIDGGGSVLGQSAPDAVGSFLSMLERRQGVFFVAVFSMLGKLSKADGQVTRAEIDAVEAVIRQHLRLDNRARRLAIRVFNQAKDAGGSFDDYAQQFYQEFKMQPVLLSSLIDLLLVVAHADGAIKPEEQAMIMRAVKIFHLEGAYEQIKARHSPADSPHKSYEILGASPHETLAEIKKKYRRLAMEYHPDRVKARGVPPELVAAAEARFKAIQHAFDLVEKQHKKT